MKRPTFFISSTIYDFSDLRSAIKYFLEQQGCEVLASEYNDFRKSLDVHSYQACLDSIHQADYFILLVGTRVGGWYDKANRISITQKEYREAYDLHIKGHLKILNFIRLDLWNLKNDRSELEKYLKDLDIEESISKSIKNHPTKRVSDPDFIINFIQEISKNKETQNASNGKSEFPTGNWIHIFNSFRDIADVLKPIIFDGIPIEDAILRRLLLSELREILRENLVKFGTGRVLSPTEIIRNFYREHELETHISSEQYTFVNTKRWDMLCTLAINLLSLKTNPLILPQALSSSTFLRFDNDKGVFEEEPIFHALNLLNQEIISFNKNNTSETLAVVFAHSPKTRDYSTETIRINSIKLLTFLHLMLRWSNIITISKAVIKYLEGGSEFTMPRIFEKSPIPNLNKELEDETVTQEEVSEFLKL